MDFEIEIEEVAVEEEMVTFSLNRKVFMMDDVRVELSIMRENNQQPHVLFRVNGKTLFQDYI